MRIDRKTITLEYAGWFDAETMCQLKSNILKFQLNNRLWMCKYSRFKCSICAWNAHFKWCEWFSVSSIHQIRLMWHHSRKNHQNLYMFIWLACQNHYFSQHSQRMREIWDEYVCCISKYLQQQCKKAQIHVICGIKMQSNSFHKILPVRWRLCVCVLIDRHTMRMVFIFLLANPWLNLFICHTAVDVSIMTDFVWHIIQAQSDRRHGLPIHAHLAHYFQLVVQVLSLFTGKSRPLDSHFAMALHLLRDKSALDRIVTGKPNVNQFTTVQYATKSTHTETRARAGAKRGHRSHLLEPCCFQWHHSSSFFLVT